MVKLAVVWLAAKVTVVGTVASPVLLLASVTVSGCVLSPAARVNAAVKLVPPTTVVVARLIPRFGPTLPMIVSAAIAAVLSIGTPVLGSTTTTVMSTVDEAEMGRLPLITPTCTVTDACPAAIVAALLSDSPLGIVPRATLSAALVTTLRVIVSVVALDPAASEIVLWPGVTVSVGTSVSTTAIVATAGVSPVAMALMCTFRLPYTTPSSSSGRLTVIEDWPAWNVTVEGGSIRTFRSELSVTVSG